MILSKAIYDLISTAPEITCPEIWAGLVPKRIDPSAGLLSITPLPSAGVNFAQGNTTELYQVDVWARDIYIAEGFRDEVVSYFKGLAGIVEGTPLIFNIDAILGVLYEENGDLYHYPITIAVRLVR